MQTTLTSQIKAAGETKTSPSSFKHPKGTCTRSQGDTCGAPPAFISPF